MKLFAPRAPRTPAQLLRLTLINGAIVIALEVALKHVLARYDVVSALFAAGGASYPRAVLALMFVLLRLFACLILPGLIVRDVFLALAARRAGVPAAGR